jgi:ABC-type branched-subunit amino acid transport system substrate-binding protein
MRQAAQMGLSARIKISGFATFDQEAIDAMGSASEGVYAVNRYSNELPNAENAAFVKVFREMYVGKDLLPGPTAAAGSYGTILMAAKAFELAKSSASDRFSEAMGGLSAMLPQGMVRVSKENNIFEQPIYIMQIRNQRYHVVADLGPQKHPGLEACSVK